MVCDGVAETYFGLVPKVLINLGEILSYIYEKFEYKVACWVFNHHYKLL